jgi:PAS domain S-box-containing protein
VTQLAPSDTHYILSYAANSTTVGGADLGSNPSRLAAFRQAEAQRQPIASGTVEFAATATAPAQTGFFITVPIAYEANPEKIIGFVNAVFNYQDFFTDTFTGKVSQGGLDIVIKDAADGKEVLASKNASSDEKVFRYESAIAVADRVWTLQVSAPFHFGSSHSNLPTAVFAVGQIFSALLIVIFWIQARGRREALNVVDDITHDLQLERNMAVANDQKSKAILSSIGDGVFAIDIKGNITVFNPAASLISGISEQRAIGQHYGDVLRFEFEKTGKINDGFIKRALDGHLAGMANHTVIIRPDGKKIPVADSAAPIRNVAGAIIGAIVVFRDVSKEHELDKAKTEFVSLASHQLRTPLSAINWYGEMLLSGDAGKLNKDQHEYIREIFEGSQRMVELVNSLLDVSRIEVGKLISKPAPTDVTELIRSLRKELTVSIDNKNLKIHEEIRKIPLVTADPKHLRMIVQNLMSNAVKYTSEKGSIDVTLRAATAEDLHMAQLKKPGGYWFFSVKDDGYGIPKSEQGKIFGKLFRADNVRKLDVEGTGLGLYIVKEVVEKMGGRVWFESEEGTGTTFYVVAPVDTRHAKK